MLSNFDAVVKRIPSVLQSPMKPFIRYVETAIYPGLTILSWTSLNIDHCKKTYLKPFIFNAIFGLQKFTRAPKKYLDTNVTL